MQKEQYNFSELIRQVDDTIAFVELRRKEPGPFEQQLPAFLHEMGGLGIKFIAPRRKPVRNSQRDGDILPTPPQSPRGSSEPADAASASEHHPVEAVENDAQDIAAALAGVVSELSGANQASASAEEKLQEDDEAAGNAHTI